MKSQFVLIVSIVLVLFAIQVCVDAGGAVYTVKAESPEDCAKSFESAEDPKCYLCCASFYMKLNEETSKCECKESRTMNLVKKFPGKSETVRHAYQNAISDIYLEKIKKQSSQN